MGEQVAERWRAPTRVSGRETVGREVLPYRGVEVDETLLPELHEGDGGEGLGDRGDSEHGATRDRRRRGDIGATVTPEVGEATVTDNADGQSHRRLVGHDPVHQGVYRPQLRMSAEGRRGGFRPGTDGRRHGIAPGRHGRASGPAFR